MREHIASVESHPSIAQHLAVYHSILANHMQDALDDIEAYIHAHGTRNKPV
jgi:hypothetical protein